MALLGASIDPSLFRQDYSGFVNAANTNAKAIAGLGQTIAGSLEKYGEEKKERKKLDAGIKASVTGIESAIKMGKSLGIDIESSLSPYLQKINDPNISAVEAAAYAQEASNSISNAFNLGMKGRELTVQEGRYAQQDRASQAAAYIDATKPLELTDDVYITGDNQGIDILKDKFGNIYDRQTKLRIINPEGYATGLPLDQVLEQKDASGMPINSVYNPAEPTNAGGVLPELETNVPKIPAAQQATSDAGGAVPPDQVAAPENANPIDSAATLSRGQPSQLTPRARSITKPPLVNVNTGDDPQQQRQSAIDKSLLTIKDEAAQAASQLSKINEISNLLNKGVETGFAQDVLMQAGKVFGKDVSNQEAFKAASGSVALGFINLTKGAISDKEMTYFTKVLAPSIGTSVEGNKKIADYLRRSAEKAAKVEEIISTGMRSGKSAFDIDSEVQKFRNTETIISEETGTSSGPLDGIYKKHEI